MMSLLAEISDKMATPFQMWEWTGWLSLPLIAFAVINRWTALAGLISATALSALLVWVSFQEAYRDDVLGRAIWREMGGSWVFHSIASGMLPVVLVSIVAALRWWLWRVNSRRDVALENADDHGDAVQLEAVL